MRQSRNRRFRATNRQAIIFTLVACMLVGIVVGAVAGSGVTSATSTHLSGYLHSFKDSTADGMDVLRESALKYGKLFVFIWLLAFMPSGGLLPVGGFIAMLLIIFRGAAYGFSTAALISSYGTAGVVCAAILYLPQFLLLMPAYIFTAYRCVRFIQKTGEIKNYLPVLLVGLCISLFAGFIDAFVAPGLVRGWL